jgi:hypothetical protein
MKEKYLQILSIALTASFGVLIVWLYWAAPKNLEEVSLKAQATYENVTTKAQVITNIYEVDKAKFDEGLQAFRQDNFILARDLFQRADPERRDAKTQFYIAYTFYRQGWGRFTNDDELFKKGLEEVNRVIALDKNFKSDDANLQLRTPIELKNEFEEGMRVTISDFNPLRVLRERK